MSVYILLGVLAILEVLTLIFVPVIIIEIAKVFAKSDNDYLREMEAESNYRRQRWGEEE
jgi:hypothetical protein